MLTYTHKFKVRVIDAEAYQLYWKHHDAWKAAKQSMEATPWWRVIRRAKFHAEYRRNLFLACDYDLKAVRIERG